MDRKSPVDSHIGQRLKEYRQHRGMTVRELADAAHVTPGQISRYEHGRDRISHERVTEFARILRIKSNDLYQPPGSQLRRNHVRWRLTNFMAAVIAEAAALMSSRRKAAADNEATMVAAVAVAVGASAAAASDAGAGEKSSLTTSADDTAVDISGSLSGAALKFNPIWHRMAETVTDKERIIVVEGKLEISDAVSETIFRADAETTLQLDASDAANALLIMELRADAWRIIKKMCPTLPILISLSVIPGILIDLAKISVRTDHGHNQLYVCAPRIVPL